MLRVHKDTCLSCPTVGSAALDPSHLSSLRKTKVTHTRELLHIRRQVAKQKALILSVLLLSMATFIHGSY